MLSNLNVVDVKAIKVYSDTYSRAVTQPCTNAAQSDGRRTNWLRMDTNMCG